MVLREIDQAKMQNQGAVVKHHNYRTNKPFQKKKTQSVIGDIFGFLHARVLMLDAENEARIKDKWETSYKI